MVYITSFVAAAILSHLASAVPVPDSAIGPEVAVSAPNGVIESDTAALATATALNNYGSNQNNYGSSSNNYNNNYNMGSNYDNSNNYNTDTYNSDSTSTLYDNNVWNTDTYMSDSTSTLYDNNVYNTDTYMSDSTSTYSAYNTYNTDTSDSTSTYYANNNYNTDTYDSYSTSTYSAYNTYTTSTSAYYTTSTYDTYSALATSTYSYGSGSSSWGNSGYDNCVQQCMASYAPPLATYTPSPSSNQDDSAGSAGTNGVTHTVIVAPTQGVLRYVPFAVNASVGDTIQFMWGANNHTVTKSSELLPCNKTADSPFASGEQNQGFAFSQVVNDTNPTFFYCGTPGHCEKGMFGIINPPSAYSSSMSVGNALPNMSANNSDIAAMASYTSAQTSNNQYAAQWGSSIDMTSLPSWSYQYVAENTMYTRTFLAANPDVITSNGVDLGAAGSNPLMIPQDISVALSNDANSTSASTTAATSAAATSGGSAPSPTASTNGASSLASPRILIAAMAVVATFFAL